MEFRVGLHGFFGVSFSGLRSRADSWRVIGWELGADNEMLNIGLFAGKCEYPPSWTVDMPDYECSRIVWNALHATVFLWGRTARWYTVEAGPSVTLYFNGDDFADRGLLAGIQANAEIGRRFLFAGLGMRTGIASDPRFGTGLDMVWSPHLRLVFGRDR